MTTRDLPAPGSTRREIAQHWIRHFRARLTTENPPSDKRAYHPATLGLKHWKGVLAALPDTTSVKSAG